MKKVLLAIFLLIVVPALALFGLYTFNGTVKDMANGLLAQVPGPIGTYFQSMPTPQDTDAQLVTIANYLLTLERKQAVDKLNLIENDDAATFQSVVRGMVRLDPSKTEKILEEKRLQSLKTNVVQSTLEQISQEQAEEVKTKAQALTDLSLQDRIKEFKRILKERIDGFEFLASLIDNMPADKVGEVMPYLEEATQDKLYSLANDEISTAIKRYISDKEARKTSLYNTAQIMTGKSLEDLVPILGSNATYSTDELIAIYETMGPKKAGEIMARIEDDAFVFSIVNGIKDSKILKEGADNFTGDLLKALNIYKAYDDNINELVSIYSQVEDSKTADIIKRLYWNTGQIKRYALKNGDEIVISDQQLALDILKSFPSKKIASVLSYLDNSISTEISTKLALPNL